MADQEQVSRRKGTIIWDLAQEAPELLECLPDSARAALDSIRESGSGLVARTVAPFETKTFYRPSRHVRAFYQRVTDKAGGEAILAYKGSEVWAEDLASIAAEMGQGRISLNKHDFFIMGEGKTPIVYLLHEALGDARKGLALFRAMRATFSCHPKLPLPLCIIKWPDEPLERYRDAVFPHLSSTARELVTRNLTDGLAEYVYYYPGGPARLRHAKRSAEHADPRSTYQLIDQWVTLFTQMLCAGYLPLVLSNQKAGTCVQPQNVCMDGGFVDVESVEELSADPIAFGLNLMASVQILASSICVSLMPWLSPEFRTPDALQVGNVFGGGLHQMLFLPHVWRMVENKLKELTAGGKLRVDERLAAIFGSEQQGAEGLQRMLKELEKLTALHTSESLGAHTSV